MSLELRYQAKAELKRVGASGLADYLGRESMVSRQAIDCVIDVDKFRVGLSPAESR